MVETPKVVTSNVYATIKAYHATSDFSKLFSIFH
jgi:hypothetical protein